MARAEGNSPIPFATTGGDESDRVTDVQYGREVTLPKPNYQDPSGIWVDDWIGAPVDVVWASWPEPRQATLTLRLPGPIVYSVYVTVTMTLGGNAKFSRTFPLSPGVHTALRVFGKSIVVQAFTAGSNVALAPGVAQRIVGAITEGDLNPLGELVSVWNPKIGLNNASSGFAQAMTRPGFPTSGYLLSLTGFLTTSGGAGAAVAGTPYFLQVFDILPDLAQAWIAALASPTPQLRPLVVLGPIVGGANASFSFDRSLRPSVRFTQGLGIALSTRADIYVAPPASIGLFVAGDYGI